MVGDVSPYEKFLGMTASDDNGEATYKMPFREQHIGNPLIKTFHGGIIASFAELVAGAHLTANQTEQNKPVCSSMTLDYLRPAFAGTLVAKPNIIREGKRFIVVVVDVIVIVCNAYFHESGYILFTVIVLVCMSLSLSPAP